MGRLRRGGRAAEKRGAAGVAVSIGALALAATGLAPRRLAGGDPVARLSLGSGFWLLVLAAYAAFVVALREAARRQPRLAQDLGPRRLLSRWPCS